MKKIIKQLDLFFTKLKMKILNNILYVITPVNGVTPLLLKVKTIKKFNKTKMTPWMYFKVILKW